MDQLLVSARPDPFGARATLTTANGATVVYYRLAALAGAGRRPISTGCRSPSASCSKTCFATPASEFVDADDVETLATWTPRRRRHGDGRRAAVYARPRRAAGLHRRAVRGRSRRDARGDGAARRRRDPDQPARAGRSGHRPLGPGRPLRHLDRLRDATSISNTSATASATSFCAGRSSRSRTSASCRPAPASSIRSISNISRRWSDPRRSARDRSPSPTRWSAPTPTPR